MFDNILCFILNQDLHISIFCCRSYKIRHLKLFEVVIKIFLEFENKYISFFHKFM